MTRKNKRRTKKYRGGVNSSISSLTENSIGYLSPESDEELNDLDNPYNTQIINNAKSVLFKEKLKSPSQVALVALGATLVGLLITVVVKKGKL